MLALLRSSMGAFLGWWLGELGGLVPRRLRQQGRRERRGPVLIFGRQQSVVLQRTATTSACWAASTPMPPITTSV